MKKRIVMLPSVGEPPVGDLADLILARLESLQPTPKPPPDASVRVPRR